MRTAIWSIHRDLKPANILVSDDRRVHLLISASPKLLDDPVAHGSRLGADGGDGGAP